MVRHVLLAMVVGIWATGSAFAADIAVDGHLTDWNPSLTSTAVGSAVNHSSSFWQPTISGAAYWYGDGTVSPGAGGQNFDVEAAYMVSQNGKLYGAFVSGFDTIENNWSGSTPSTFRTGDLFFQTSNGTGWDFAIAMSSHDGFAAGDLYVPDNASSTWYSAPYYDGVHHSPDYSVAGPALLTGSQSDFTVYTPANGVEMAYVAGCKWDSGVPGSGTLYDQPRMDWLGSGYDHNVTEVAIPWTLASQLGLDSGDITMHYTMECGNDYFSLTLPRTSIPPSTVPEPGLAVLALGAVVAGVWARRRKVKS